MTSSTHVGTATHAVLTTALFLSGLSWGVAQTLVSAPSAQNFGQTAASTPATQTLTYLTAGTSAPTFSLTYGSEYSLGTARCTGGSSLTCSLPVTFQPRLPGLRQDAVLVKSASGNTLATSFLYGVGLAPEASLFPGVITTVAGTGAWGYGGDGALATAATLRNPQGIAIDQVGNLYIADSVNQVVRMVNKKGQICTLVGTGVPGYTGDGGPAAKGTLNSPIAVALDGAGNLYIADQGNNVVRKVSAGTSVISTLVGGGAPLAGLDGFGDGGPAANAILNGPSDLAVDGAGNIFIADSFNGLIRKVTAATGIITVVAGGGTSAGSDGYGNGGAATSAPLNDPSGIGLDSSGNIYIADTGSSMIRRVDAVSGIITAVAGNGRSGYSGDTGLATSATLTSPSSVRVDAAGNIYLTDQARNVIRQVSALARTIVTVAGSGLHRYSGDGGSPLSAAFADPAGLALDANGNVFIADFTNNAIREIVLSAGWAMTFPTTLIGQASPPQVLSVMNTGNQPLNPTTLTMPANFIQQAYRGSDCSAGSSVAAGGLCTIAVAFVPTQLGSLTGSLSLKTNAPGVSGTLISTLSGTGASGAVPNVTLSMTGLTFTDQPVGTASTAKVVSLSNTGGAPLQLSSMAVGGPNAPDFTVSTTCQTVVAAGAGCSISIVFRPAAFGSRSATITLFDNVANSPQSIALTGNGAGLPQASLSSSTIQFGSRAVGAAGPAQTITLSNTGSGALTISSVSVSGANASDFSASGICGSSVPAGGTCAISMSFNPHHFGASGATLNLTTNASPATQVIALSGIGTVKALPTVWRPSNGTWYSLPPNASTPTATQWGLPGDMPISGDYDGDGIIDVAVYRPGNQMWYIIPSGKSIPYSVQWGIPGDVPVPADYDGDGKTDIAIYRPSNGNWFIIPSSTGAYYVAQWGLPGDLSVPGDYDGDGKADLAIYRPSSASWFIVRSSTNASYVVQWGIAGDVPVPADYDGDGKTDVAVFRPSGGLWFVIPSRNGVAYSIQWGLNGDKPVAGDFDGDGKADIAVWRPATNTWFITPSAGGQAYSTVLGANGDQPIAAF